MTLATAERAGLLLLRRRRLLHDDGLRRRVKPLPIPLEPILHETPPFRGECVECVV